MSDKQEDKPAEAGGEGKSSKKLIIIVVVIALLSVLGTGAGVYFFMSHKLGGHSEVEVKKKEKALYVDVDPAFTVAMQSPAGIRYLQISISMVTRDPEAIDLLKLHAPLIRNNLNMLFSNQDLTQLVSIEQKSSLQLKAKAEINNIMEKEAKKKPVDTVYITTFVIQ